MSSTSVFSREGSLPSPVTASGSPLFGDSPVASGRSSPACSEDSLFGGVRGTSISIDPSQQMASSRPVESITAGSVDLDPSSSQLFKSMPWYTNLLANGKDRMTLIPDELKTTARLMLDWYRDARDRSLFVDVVENRSSMKPNQKSAGPVAALLFGFRFLDIAALVASPEGVSPAPDDGVSLMLDASPSVRKSLFDSETVTLRGMSLLYTGGGWPALISAVKSTLESSEVVSDPVLPQDSLNQSPTYQLVHAAYRQLACVSDRHRAVTLSRQFFNMEMAAFFINWLLLGNKDFPDKTKDLYDFLEKKAVDEKLSSKLIQELSLPDAASFKPDVTKLRQPLFFALAISPLMLLCNFSPTSTNISRLSLMRAWFYYGNDRPPVLSKVELSLWSQLFAMAKGSKSSRQALSDFVTEVSPLLEDAESEKLFFSPHDGTLRMLPRGLAHGQLDGGIQPASTSLVPQAPDLDQNSDSSEPSNSMTDIDMSQLAEAIAAQFLQNRSRLPEQVDMDVSPASEEEPVTSPGVSVTLEKSSVDAVGASEYVKEIGVSHDGASTTSSRPEQIHVVTSSASEGELATGPDLSVTLERSSVDVAEAAGSIEKTGVSEKSTSVTKKPLDPSKTEGKGKTETSRKKPKKNEIVTGKLLSEESGRRKLRDKTVVSYDEISPLDAEVISVDSSPIVIKDDDLPPRFEPLCDCERVCSDLYLLRSPFGTACVYKGAFYSLDVVSDLVRLLDRANDSQVLHGLAPLFNKLTGRSQDNSDFDTFVGSMSGSGLHAVQRFTRARFAAVEDQGGLQNLIAASSVIVSGKGVEAGDIDRALLSTVGACSTLREAHDLSKRGLSSDADDQIVRASFDDFLKAKSLDVGGKIVNFLDIPGADSTHSTMGLSSNMAAHRYTMSLPRYARSHNLVPMRDLFWHLLATSHASHPAHVDANGFGTELILVQGLKLVFLGFPSEKDRHILAKVDGFKRFCFDLSGPESSDIVGILMLPGDRLVMQPCTPHYVFTLCPSLCHGAHFYASSTMERSYWGIVHTFFRDHEITNQDHHVYHELLFRMVAHWHDVIVNDTTSYLARCSSVNHDVVDHVPSVRSCSGWIQLLALFGLMELGTILLGERYVGAKRMDLENEYKHMRRLCGESIRVLDANVTVSAKGVDPVSVLALTRSYFVQQFIAVVRVAGISGHGGRTAAKAEQFVFQDSKRDPLLYKDVQEVLAGRCVEYSRGLVLQSSSCSSLRWAFADALVDVCVTARPADRESPADVRPDEPRKRQHVK
ncbi:hypothetical protein VNI00_010189 [Paramarasmius palmivorus]|uniref:JmjC domain-containing protein n=1 Tax=Paramarasmius palmivorus TaxID=297713 RepID=A0AAW0CJW5_9AGAR